MQQLMYTYCAYSSHGNKVDFISMMKLKLGQRGSPKLGARVPLPLLRAATATSLLFGCFRAPIL